MQGASEAFVRAAQGQPGALSGVVRISAPALTALDVLPPMLARLRRSEPGIIIELDARDSTADLLRHEADIAVRMLQVPKQDGLVAQKVGGFPLGLFAHADYLERRGEPRSLADLAHHDVIGPDRDRTDVALMATLAPGLERRHLAFRSDFHPLHDSDAASSLGACRLPTSTGPARGGLRKLMPRAVAVADCGRVISPRTALSQMYGGVVWGFSCALREQSEVDPRYAGYLNADIADYVVAVNADLGEIEVALLDQPDPLANAVGAKGLGELAMVGAAAAIANAIFHAIGRRVRSLPIRIEDLL